MKSLFFRRRAQPPHQESALPPVFGGGFLHGWVLRRVTNAIAKDFRIGRRIDTADYSGVLIERGGLFFKLMLVPVEIGDADCRQEIDLCASRIAPPDFRRHEPAQATS